MLNRDEMKAYLHLALDGPPRPVERLNLAMADWKHLPWPSGISSLDMKTNGGFYGLSAICGYPKLGKSMIAIRSSIMAAIAGWDVIYVNAENADSTMSDRAHAVFGPEMADWPEAGQRWDVLNVFGNASLPIIVDQVCERLPSTSQGLLLVFDSLTRLAKFGEVQGANFFRALRQLTLFSATLVRQTHGQIGVLAISELNRKGGATGQDLEYAANCLLYLRSGRGPGSVTMTLDSRETAGGDLGEFLRVPEECRFHGKLEAVDDERYG